MDESLIKQLISSITCGSCGKNYDEDHIEIIEHKEEMWFLRVSCPHCQLKCLVAAIVREDDESEVITDLMPAELEKFKNRDGISEDDLLDMHDFLKNFDGDFPHAFRQK
jgi:hypothetical protein